MWRPSLSNQTVLRHRHGSKVSSQQSVSSRKEKSTYQLPQSWNSDARYSSPVFFLFFYPKELHGRAVTEKKTGVGSLWAAANEAMQVAAVTEKSFPVPFLLDLPHHALCACQCHTAMHAWSSIHMQSTSPSPEMWISSILMSPRCALSKADAWRIPWQPLSSGISVATLHHLKKKLY